MRFRDKDKEGWLRAEFCVDGLVVETHQRTAKEPSSASVVALDKDATIKLSNFLNRKLRQLDWIE